MELKELRRAQVARESAGYLAMPLVYAALMGLHVFLYIPALVALSFGLVFLLLLQVRSSRVAGGLSQGPEGPAGGPRPPAGALEEADRRFLRQAASGALANVAGYLTFLAALDLHLRATLAGGSPGALLLAGALVGIVLAAGGREAARRAAWAGFEARFPALWVGAQGLDGGRATRSARAYLAWRAGVERRA